MLHIAHFIITPNAQAEHWFPSALDSAFASLLLEPTVLSRRYADRSAWQAEDLKLIIKLLFIARIRELEPLNAANEAVRVLGSDEVSQSVFDSWWSINPIVYEGPSEEMHEFVRPVAAKLSITGNQLVDDFLARISAATPTSEQKLGSNKG